jgi:hypothetical protein
LGGRRKRTTDEGGGKKRVEVMAGIESYDLRLRGKIDKTGKEKNTEFIINKNNLEMIRERKSLSPSSSSFVFSTGFFSGLTVTVSMEPF